MGHTEWTIFSLNFSHEAGGTILGLKNFNPSTGQVKSICEEFDLPSANITQINALDDFEGSFELLTDEVMEIKKQLNYL